MHKGHIASGTVEGTGADINILLGFKPSYVRIVNEDGLATLEWFDDMTDGHGIKMVEATGVTMSKITSLGVTPYDGTAAGDGAGFTIGADTDINVSAETLHYFAYSRDA